MAFDLREIYAHLDGQTMTFERLREEIRSGMLKNFGDLSPEITWEDIYKMMGEMGWITFPNDGSFGMNSTIKFEMCEDKREVEKRKETYKKHFIRQAAKRFPRDLKNGLVDIPAKFNTAEYKQAVRELLNQ